ncbi:terpene cyclase/mutase family protein [Jeotgalibacillus marinus]|uniref:Prenyltransferase/squalene oxidase repeat-containing protein n=1 Tax=Jeotgalibacillus marinus TaxID=86667 RepID=A0ABV3Q306_9BACL
MIEKNRILNEIQQRVNNIKKKQFVNGAWYLCCDPGVLVDSFSIMTLRAVEHYDEKFIHDIAEYIYTQQDDNGAWKLYEDEYPGNLTTTASAYNALLLSGYFKKTDSNMKKAEKQIISMGGLNNVHFLAKAMFSANGQYRWSLPVPIYTILLPHQFPLNFFDLSCYARVHFAPMMIIGNLKYHKKIESKPDLSHLIINNKRKVPLFKHLPTYLHPIRKRALKKLEEFILDRLEPDGTLYNYSSATFFMIYSLLARGYDKSDSIICDAISSLKATSCHLNGLNHIQNAPSTIWDTALLSYSLQEAGVSSSDPVINKSVNYLINHQQTQKSDWAIHNPNITPGGWGFSEDNTKNPDIDDTTATLRAIYLKSKLNSKIYNSWEKGLNWVLSMQNDDGGWPAFEKNVDNTLIGMLPIQNVKEGALDASTADLTGRTLEFLGNYAGYTKGDLTIQKAIRWLKKRQEKDGSWYGRWGVCYLYGTWAAITGLCAVGISIDDSTIQKANKWLLTIQKKDGGWGESCSSDIIRKYVSLPYSTPTQTAWALDSLIAIHDSPTDEINKGIQFLMNNTKNINYPTGAGFPDLTYFHYHSYNDIFPLLTLSHYYNKYGSGARIILPETIRSARPSVISP